MLLTCRDGPIITSNTVDDETRKSRNRKRHRIFDKSVFWKGYEGGWLILINWSHMKLILFE